MALNVKNILHRVFIFILASQLFSCFKGDPPEKFMPPPEIRIEATVPEYIYTNINSAVLDARRTMTMNGKRNLLFQWDCLEYPAGSSPAFSNPREALTLIDNLKVGAYKLRLSVSDSAGNKAFASFSMDVLNDTLKGPPILNILRDTVIHLPQRVISISGDKAYSVNPPGRELQFLWSVIQQPAGSPPLNIHFKTSMSTNIDGYAAGIYQIRLQVTNEIGLSAADTMELNILGDSLPGKSKIYENLRWIQIDDGWDYYYMTTILDPDVFTNRDEKSMEVQVWDQAINDWAPKDKFGWYLTPGGINIIHYDFSLSILGTVTKAKVKFL